jgi:hypothetical protein
MRRADLPAHAAGRMGHAFIAELVVHRRLLSSRNRDVVDPMPNASTGHSFPLP